ncbi:centriolar coiled-coil protein of 110 kDa-like isoform X2 [Scyliorhinus torazame]|uniref:centriolar coiled-coil protein of 110 kDa-like isoform X2 n=1 Tax=Scyliorhinus torazame TaxID=75743 RepID=UPI003B5B6B3D
MEEYEDFCKRHLARIQMMENNSLQSIWQKSNSVIYFHGIAALCPLVNTERKLEMQQYRQKAVELELSRQKARKSALLTRVQEIIENVQMEYFRDTVRMINNGKKTSLKVLYINARSIRNKVDELTVQIEVCQVPSTTECVKDPVTHPATKPGPTNDFTTTQHTDRSSLSPSYSDKPDGSVPSTKTLLKLKERITVGYSEKSISSPQISDLPKAICSIQSDDRLSVCVSPKNEESETVTSPIKEIPDHYAMSLQNLLKKSREYVEREQNRRNGKNAPKEGANESHSNKENEGVKINDWERERNRISNKSSSPVRVDKSSSARSFPQPQVASSSRESFELSDKRAVSPPTSVLCSSSKVDFPAKIMRGLSRDSDSDEDWLTNENSLLKSLMGSYAKLPNPEPSRSPKMHQRRPRASTHIVINNPVNAYELSPKEKFRGLPGTEQGKMNISDHSIKRAVSNEALIAVNQKEIEKNQGKLQDIPTGLGRIHDIPTKSCSQFLCAEPSGKSDVKVFGAIVGNEVQVPLRSLILKDLCDLERASPLHTDHPEITQPLEAQNEHDLSGHKAGSLTEKAKQSSPIELNKSYDVEHPSPVLLQTQNTRQQMDLTAAPSENETSLQSSIEAKAKRKLALATLDAKENELSVVETAGSNSQEMSRWIREKRYQRVSVSRSENEVTSTSHINALDEEHITKQMMAFAEMRKQLEEQHTLQLSMLIAEQEKEQEKLQREIEEQERRFREQRNFVMDSSGSCSSKETSLGWRRINENYPMPSLINGVDGHQSSISPNIAFTSNSASAEFPFSRWGAGGDDLHEMQSSCYLSRPRNRWSQINAPEVQKRFNKVSAVAKGFLTRRLMKTEKLKQLQQTVKDTLEFINNLQTEAPLKRGAVSSQDVSLHERVIAQLRAALYEIHDIFFVLDPDERMQILCHDREIRKEKQLRQMEKWKSPKERGALSVATQRSLDRKRQIKAAEMGITSKQKSNVKPKSSSETRILQPSQGQNAPVQRLLHRQGSVPRKSVENKVKRYDTLRKQHSIG